MSALLDRLEGVRQTAPGRWLARCPAHDDRSPSLSVRQTDDGTWLVYCFAGCHALDIVQAIGLELSDLFPQQPEQFRKATPRRIPASDALIALEHEIKVAWMVMTQMIEKGEINDEDWSRLTTAARRISSARALCCPARYRL